MGMTSFRIPDDLLSRLEHTATRLSRSKAWVIKDAVQQYLEQDERKARRLEETRDALADVEAGRLIEGDEMIEWMESWGTDNEREPPHT